MPRRLHYFAQPFWIARPGSAQRYEFTCAVDAEEGGRLLMRQADGVLVYQQWVDCIAEIIEDPEVLAVLGEVPNAALVFDQPDQEPWELDAA